MTDKASCNERESDDCTDTTEIFSGLLERLGEVLAARSESVAAAAMQTLIVRIQGVRMIRSESGLKVCGLDDCATTAQCTALASYINDVTEVLPVLSLAERLEVKVRQRAQHCMLGKMTLRNKRRWLWLLCRLLVNAQRWQPHGAEQLQNQQLMLSYLLHEPIARIEKLWREHLFWFYFNYARRLLHLQPCPESNSYLDSFFWPDQGDYYRVTHNNNASRVLLSIHMGDFFGAYRVLSALSTPGRQVISLRRDIIANHGMQNFSADRINHRVFFHQHHQATAIVSALRRGGLTLATLFDLRGDFGSTVAVEFFGRPARFVKGPAQLAIMGRSPIFVFVCHEHQGRNCIEMAPQIDTRLMPGESLHQGTVRVTQILVKLAESWIRRCPAQWKYLNVLPAYFEAAT